MNRKAICDCGHPASSHFDECGGRCIGNRNLCTCRRFNEPIEVSLERIIENEKEKRENAFKASKLDRLLAAVKAEREARELADDPGGDNEQALWRIADAELTAAIKDSEPRP